MDYLDDERRIAAYFDRLVDTHGYSHQAIDASSRRSLERRYEVLGSATDLTGKRVLEVGCGLGDFGAYLHERFDGLEYTGIDISPRMLEEAHNAHPGLKLRRANIMELSEVERYDAVLGLGIFYLLGGTAEEKVPPMVAKMYSLATELVAFSTLSSWAPHQEPNEYYMDPIFALELARKLTPVVVLRHDYSPGDLAMYLYRRDNA